MEGRKGYNVFNYKLSVGNCSLEQCEPLLDFLEEQLE
jgi:hypothetical protein